MLGGFLSNLINPEIAAGHPSYVRNYHLLSQLKTLCFLGSLAVAGVLWLLVCLLVIRAKKRSYFWLLLAALGPIGFAVLATLKDRDAAVTDRYAEFVRKMNLFVRTGYEVSSFVAICVLAYQAMVVLRTLIIWYQAVTTGMSTQQIIDLQTLRRGCGLLAREWRSCIFSFFCTCFGLWCFGTLPTWWRRGRWRRQAEARWQIR